MSPSEGITKELDEKYVQLIGKFVSDIKNGKLRGSNNTALATVTLLEQIINHSQNATAYELVGTVRCVCAALGAALPHALAAANVARRLLRAIRDENRPNLNQSGECSGASLQRLVLAAPARRGTLGAAQDLRGPAREHLAELRLELESSGAALSAQAREHVRGEELVLALGGGGGGGGGGALTERFLRAAAPAGYQLVLAEGLRVAESHAMASRLSAAGVPVTVISNAAICAVMSRVNKVVISVAAALGGGGAALAAAGTLAVVQAAQHYSVPVLALAPLYKLSPLHARDAARINELTAPHATLPYERCEVGAVHTVAPMYDYLPPELITLFITNLGGSSPSYMYRMLSELYDPSDYTI